MRRALPAVAAALLLVGAGCSGGGDGFELPAPDSSIDVDTPKLREMKAEAGIEPCRAGGEQGSNDLPRVALPCLGGGPDVRLDEIRGPAVVNFWASWCGPCRQELPILQGGSEAYAGRVAFLGVDFTDAQTESAMTLLGDSGVTYPQVADPGGDLTGEPVLKRLVKVPTTAFVAADGEVSTEVAPMRSAEQLDGLIEQHLGVESR